MENIPFSKISVVGNERRYLDEVLQSGHLSSDGAFCRRCEAWLSDNLSGASVLMTNSGTAALDLAAAAMGLEPGDEVIMPSFTFVSTANAVCRLGAIPKFVDVSPGTMNMDADLVEAAITPRTRAIFPVHYAGIGCAPDRITDIAARHELTVVEDAAQGLCATFDGRPLGTFGAMAAFSFHEQKNVGCGEAGALVINDPAALDRAHVIRDKGTNRRAFFQGLASFYSWVGVGASYGLSDLSAAFLLGQLEKADEITATRRRIQAAYRERLAPLAAQEFIELQHIPDTAETNGHITFISLQSRGVRDALIAHLNGQGIKAVFHYIPLHSSPFGQTLGYSSDDLPVTEDRSARLLRLPMYHELSDADIDRISDAIHAFFGTRA